MIDYIRTSQIFKSLSDPTRIQILEILSNGTLCACKILEKLQISQSTLSHHMKVFVEGGLVEGKKEGTWMHYSINREAITELHRIIDKLTLAEEGCCCSELLGETQSGVIPK